MKDILTRMKIYANKKNAERKKKKGAITRNTEDATMRNVMEAGTKRTNGTMMRDTVKMIVDVEMTETDITKKADTVIDTVNALASP